MAVFSSRGKVVKEEKMCHKKLIYWKHFTNVIQKPFISTIDDISMNLKHVLLR